ncbi:putative galacturonosyltransferase 10 [Hordeum vulgare]|nr:putative galacturonosyltransferase 10 [Hordeum vulgare]
MVRPAGLFVPTTPRSRFLDQLRPSFRRRWRQRPLWAHLLLLVLLNLACALLLLALAGFPDPSFPPATDDPTRSAHVDTHVDVVSSPLLSHAREKEEKKLKAKQKEAARLQAQATSDRPKKSDKKQKNKVVDDENPEDFIDPDTPSGEKK